MIYLYFIVPIVILIMLFFLLSNNTRFNQRELRNISSVIDNLFHWKLGDIIFIKVSHVNSKKIPTYSWFLYEIHNDKILLQSTKNPSVFLELNSLDIENIKVLQQYNKDELFYNETFKYQQYRDVSLDRHNTNKINTPLDSNIITSINMFNDKLDKFIDD